MMTFCVIAPASGLHAYATLSKRHLVLAQVKNVIYRDFYRQRREAGDLLILDNGAYEGNVNEDEIMEAATFYQPQVMVLPDILMGDPRDSFKRSFDFWKDWRARLDVEWMYVPQAPPNDISGFMWSTRIALDNIQPQWIGIPRALATDVWPHEQDGALHVRADFCNHIRAFYNNVRVHALGMAAGNIHELYYLREAECDSIDSSAPVWRGWLGFDICDPVWHTAGSKVNFDARPLSPHSARNAIIVNNLRQCGVNTDAGV